MEVKVKEMLEILLSLKPGLTSKTIIEQTDCYAFQDGKVFTYNDEIAVSHPIPWEIEGAVISSPLLGLLSKVNDETVEIEITKKGMVIEGARFKTEISLYEEIKLPIDQIGNPTDWKKLPKNFVDAVSYTMFTAAKDMTKPSLACLHVKGDKVESSDKFRITQFTLDKKFPGTYLFPAWNIKHLINFEPIEFTTTQGWGHFRMENGAIFSMRIFPEENYPNVDKHLKVEGQSLKIPDEVSEILERAQVIVKGEFEADQLVDIAVEPGKLTVSGKGPHGKFTERIRIRYDSDPINFSINLVFLSQILKHLKETTVSENTMKFIGSNYVHLISLPHKK